MSFDPAGKLLLLLAAGEDLDSACHKITTEMLFEQMKPDPVLRFVHRDIPVGAVPDAKCVADRLRGSPNPTRDEVSQAIAACTRTP